MLTWIRAVRIDLCIQIQNPRKGCLMFCITWILVAVISCLKVHAIMCMDLNVSQDGAELASSKSCMSRIVDFSIQLSVASVQDMGLDSQIKSHNKSWPFAGMPSALPQQLRFDLQDDVTHYKAMTVGENTPSISHNQQAASRQAGLALHRSPTLT